MDFFSVFFLFDLLPWLVCIVLGFVVIEIYLEIFREKKWNKKTHYAINLLVLMAVIVRRQMKKRGTALTNVRFK